MGYHTLPLTYIFMFITGIISYPLGKVLDIVLGEEMGVNYKKQAFLELIKQGQNDLEGIFYEGPGTQPFFQRTKRL